MADIDVTVTYNNGTIALSSTSSSWNAAEEKLSVKGTTGSKTIAYTLSTVGASLAGIKVATTQLGVSNATTVTSGSITGTPFSVSISSNVLTLTDNVGIAADSQVTYYYAIGVNPPSGPQCWHDPRIYNTGGD